MQSEGRYATPGELIAVAADQAPPLRIKLARPVPPELGPRHGGAISRPDPPRGRGEDAALLLHVRPQILLDEDHAGSAGFRGKAECER